MAQGRFCPACGHRHGGSLPKLADPYVGRTIGGRYEVGELISIGGMGRVHRGLQWSLDRGVAIKFIHRHLLSTREFVSRFMLEARAASRLNHPNIVSVFDFGRTQPSDGGDLYIVMELLAGVDLGRVLERGELLPVPRVVDVVRQTLAGLGEAHHRGITHRDVKPENIVLEAFRVGADHVKVIDFGIASMPGAQRVTAAGQTIGTPAYMSPEQSLSQAVGPRSDLYAVAVILFELLTGRLPFDDASPALMLRNHLHADRPDPREVAPERAIPDALAAACRRGMSIDPGERFEDASAFAAAIADAMSTAARRSVVQVVAPSEEQRRPDESARDRASTELACAVVGRDNEIGWALELIEGGGPRAGVFWGRPGVGKTALLHQAACAARSRGAALFDAAVAPAPLSEQGHLALRQIVGALTGRPLDEPLTTVAAAAALDSAIDHALKAHPGRVVLTIDDAARMDGASLLVLAGVLRSAPPRFFVLMTSDAPPRHEHAGTIASRHVEGLAASDARSVASALGMVRGLDRLYDGVEPLYLHQLASWQLATSDEAPPLTLANLVSARIQLLAPGERRLLQAVAVLGAGHVDQLTAMIGEDVRPHIARLVAVGLVAVEREVATIRHASIRQIVVRTTPAGALADLHTAAAGLVATGDVERRAHHVLRGELGFEDFMTCEEAARLRVTRGDLEGATDILARAVHAAHVRVREDGSEMALVACEVFSRQLASALLSMGRAMDAHGVLVEALGAFADGDPASARLHHQVAIVGRLRGQGSAAERAWREAQRLANAGGDVELQEKLRGAPPDPPARAELGLFGVSP